jgi:hypothetical protein
MYEWKRRGGVPDNHRTTSAVVHMWQHITTGGKKIQNTSVEKRHYDMS